MAKAKSSFDLIIDTVPVKHDVNPYLRPVGRRCDPGPCRTGRAAQRNPHGGSRCSGAGSVAGSIIGGIPETQEMLDFCASKDILPEMRDDPDGSRSARRSSAMERADVRYRFVIDLASLAEL